jgi:hypothetical protein
VVSWDARRRDFCPFAALSLRAARFEGSTAVQRTQVYVMGRSGRVGQRISPHAAHAISNVGIQAPPGRRPAHFGCKVSR